MAQLVLRDVCQGNILFQNRGVSGPLPPALGQDDLVVGRSGQFADQGGLRDSSQNQGGGGTCGTTVGEDHTVCRSAGEAQWGGGVEVRRVALRDTAFVDFCYGVAALPPGTYYYRFYTTGDKGFRVIEVDDEGYGSIDDHSFYSGYDSFQGLLSTFPDIPRWLQDMLRKLEPHQY